MEELNNELEEFQNIIDTLECLITECKDKDNKEYLKDCLAPFYHDYNEIYDELKEESQKELDEMNYSFELSRL